MLHSKPVAGLAVAASVLLIASPALATALGVTDGRIFVDFVLVAEDPQQDTTPRSEVFDDLGSNGVVGAFVDIQAGPRPFPIVAGASIQLTGSTSQTVEARSFANSILAFDISTTGGATGPFDLRASILVDWSFGLPGGVSSFGTQSVSFTGNDPSGAVTDFFGSFDCAGSSGASVSCFGSPSADLSGLMISTTGDLTLVQGIVEIDLVGGAIGGSYFGIEYGLSANLSGGGVAGDFIDLNQGVLTGYTGSGANLEFALASLDPAVTVSVMLPEPSLAAVLATAGAALALRRRAHGGARPGPTSA